MIFLRRVRFEFQGRDDFAKQNPVAESPADDVGVFADEPKPGALGKIAFQQRPVVHVPQRPRFRAAELIHKLCQLLQLFAEHAVVIGVPRIASYGSVTHDR